MSHITEKTIPPVSMGGRAGGTKYIAQGILFKFALDTEGFYASDEGAIRAAGHELKGVQVRYLSACLLSLFFFPLLF